MRFTSAYAVHERRAFAWRRLVLRCGILVALSLLHFDVLGGSPLQDQGRAPGWRKTPPSIAADPAKRRDAHVATERRSGRAAFFRLDGCLTDPMLVCELDTDPLPDKLERSELVVVGTLQSARAFETRDGLGLYSEFTLNTDVILRGNPGSASTVTLLRMGGVWASKGHSKTILTNGQGFPQVSERYAIFASRSKWSRADWHLVTAFEIVDGRLVALDNGFRSTPFGGMTEQAFKESFRGGR